MLTGKETRGETEAYVLAIWRLVGLQCSHGGERDCLKSCCSSELSLIDKCVLCVWGHDMKPQVWFLYNYVSHLFQFYYFNQFKLIKAHMTAAYIMKSSKLENDRSESNWHILNVCVPYLNPAMQCVKWAKA